MIDDTGFTGQRVLVVGGSSGIGNGVAHGFRLRGARVHVWGTRADAGDYDAGDGSDWPALATPASTWAIPMPSRLPPPRSTGSTC